MQPVCLCRLTNFFITFGVDADVIDILALCFAIRVACWSVVRRRLFCALFVELPFWLQGTLLHPRWSAMGRSVCWSDRDLHILDAHFSLGVKHARCFDTTLHLNDAVRQVGGILITESRVIFDALTRGGSPQLRLRSARTGDEARGVKEQPALSDARIHWVNTLTMLADSLTNLDTPLVLWWNRSWSRNDCCAPLIQPLSLANAGKQEVDLCSTKKTLTTSAH